MRRLSMSKQFSLKPPAKTAAEFVAEASDAPKNDFPWLDPMVRADVIKLVSLRLSEPEYLKLKYLAEKLRMSQQEIVHGAVTRWIEEELKKS
jgi:hypothetical protein